MGKFLKKKVYNLKRMNGAFVSFFYIGEEVASHVESNNPFQVEVCKWKAEGVLLVSSTV